MPSTVGRTPLAASPCTRNERGPLAGEVYIPGQIYCTLDYQQCTGHDPVPMHARDGEWPKIDPTSRTKRNPTARTDAGWNLCR